MREQGGGGMSKGKWKRRPEKPLTETQKKAVAMYYEWEPIKDIAAACGVHRSTIWRWSQLKAFDREWKRIDYNMRRKFERREAKRRAAEDAYWDEQVRIARAKLEEESAKIKGKPGKSWYEAYENLTKAELRGKTLAECLNAFYKIKW
jgi:hypothetical protein